MRNTRVVTRKPHRCYACYRKFGAGTEMMNWCYIYEGEFCAGYTCMTCDKIMELSEENEFPEGYVCDSLERGETPEGLLSKMIQQKCEHSLARTGTLVMQM